MKLSKGKRVELKKVCELMFSDLPMACLMYPFVRSIGRLWCELVDCIPRTVTTIGDELLCCMWER